MARLIKARIITPVARIAVGKRGTKPVSMYVTNKGYPKSIEIIEKIKKIAPKNLKGCTSLKRKIIVNSIR